MRVVPNMISIFASEVVGKSALKEPIQVLKKYYGVA